MIAMVVVNWNESDIVIRSSQLAMRDGVKTVVVDNGSDDGYTDTFTRGIPAVPGEPFERVTDLYIRNPKNLGVSHARNKGISAAYQLWKDELDSILMLDGDILYIPGSAQALHTLLFSIEDAGCLGIHGGETHGVRAVAEAHGAFPEFYRDLQLDRDEAIAWTQYGLFKRAVTDRCRFDVSGYFGQPGHGWEDADFFMQMRRHGWRSYYIRGINYYHEDHAGRRELEERGLPTYYEERKAQFLSKWGRLPGEDLC